VEQTWKDHLVGSEQRGGQIGLDLAVRLSMLNDRIPVLNSTAKEMYAECAWSLVASEVAHKARCRRVRESLSVGWPSKSQVPSHR
jgi:hypothetical protein